MDIKKVIMQSEENIRQALQDYAKHTDQTTVLDDVSDTFIKRLAEDSSYAKQGLRELFSKSPVWHPELDALIINGTRTHNPDYRRVRDLATRILRKPMLKSDNHRLCELLWDVIKFFANPLNMEYHERGVKAINELAPKAYQPGKKLSRVFKALCVKLGVADETAGSEFQRLYAQFADELSSQKIGFKLFISINPAHFLTMSNPKNDQRGTCLTSCHSLNSAEYEYNCGCTGYARDEVSFIVFTVADPTDAETLNNRKTSRQIFAYKPENGLLLQSRLYNTYGGTYGAHGDSKLYRDLIQREISMLENQPNLWKVYDSASDGTYAKLIHTSAGFGGYTDWIHSSFDGKVCVRFDHLEDAEPLEVGTWGLCVCCGSETDKSMYCEDCHMTHYCYDCERGVNEEDLYEVYDSDGHTRYVCNDCLSEHYTYCDHCGEYHANDVMEYINGENVCPDCLDEYYERCSDCGGYCLQEDMYLATDKYGNEVDICPDCCEEHYETCDECSGLYHESLVCDAYASSNDAIRVCNNCLNEYYSECKKCGEFYEIGAFEDGLCPNCWELACDDNNEMEELV